MADNDRKERRKHLYYLHELSDFKVDSDDPDVRGWPVKDADNRVIGKVDNFLVSKEKKRVVYLDVEVDETIIEANHDPYGKPASGDVHEFINKDGENHLILPIGLARLNKDQKFVYTDRINHRTFAETKRMEKGYDVDREYEVVVLDSYSRDDNDLDVRKEKDSERESRVVKDTDRETYDRDNSKDEERRKIREADKDRDSSDSYGTIADKDRRTVDRDRDALTGDESGKASNRRGSGTIPEDDSFYDRGEFDYAKYRR